MKMVKSLLLGTAAGLVAMTGAQAADLPVKAKPVQYVKICSLYGAGFYYIPGTDMCIKVGGWIRQYTTYGTNGNSTFGALIDNVDTRATNNFEWRSRGYITADARNQSEYGTIRAYIAVGLNSEYAGGSNLYGAAQSFNSNRGFIQFAGFTFGLATSFFDFYSGPAVAYWGATIVPSEDTGDGGQQVWGYTAQFGGGMSATIAAEGPRTKGTVNTNVAAGTFLGAVAATATGTAFAASGQGGMNSPDIVANLRIDQAWGAAQIMGALHQVRGLYYTAADTSGNPGDKWGFAVGAGLKLFAPMIGAGDYLQAEVNYTEGAIGYLNAGGNARYAKWGSNTSYGTGMQFDGIYGAAGGVGNDIQLTSAWNVNASYEHYWNKQWKTSVYGTYHQYWQNTNGNALVCAAAAAAACPAGASDWGLLAVGSRTQWNISPDTYLGVDVVYEKLETMFSNQAVGVPTSGARPAIAAAPLSDQDAWMVQFRVHKDFYP